MGVQLFMLVAPVNSTMYTQLSGERNRIECDHFYGDHVHISRLTLHILRNPFILVILMKQSVLGFIDHIETYATITLGN